MKKLLNIFFVALLTLVGCEKFDDSEIWGTCQGESRQ